MAKNRRKQKKIEEVKEQIKKVDPVQELEREEAEIIAEQEAEDLLLSLMMSRIRTMNMINTTNTMRLVS